MKPYSNIAKKRPPRDLTLQQKAEMKLDIPATEDVDVIPAGYGLCLECCQWFTPQKRMTICSTCRGVPAQPVESKKLNLASQLSLAMMRKKPAKKSESATASRIF